MQVIWRPQPGPQTKLLTCPVRDILFGGARGGGKTDGMLGHWISHAGRYKNHARGILFRRSTNELEEVQRRAVELLQPLGGLYRASKRTWFMPDGAALKMRFLERDADAEKYQGHSYTWAAFDELGNWPNPDPVDKIRATLRSADGVPCRMLGTANPGGVGHLWLKDRYIAPAKPLTPFYDEEKRTWRVFIPSRLSDNKILQENDPDYIDRIRSSGPAWLVKAWLDGDWDSCQEGAIFKREDWQYYKTPPQFIRIYQSWDTAFKTNQENDYSVCTTWGIAQNGYYLLHRWKGKVEFPELKRVAVQLADKFKPSVVLIEDKASGQSLIQELQRETRLPLKPIKVDSDKVARAYAVSPEQEAGNLYLPEGEPWVIDYIDNMSAFPNAAHDDDVDSTTQALSEMILFRREPPRWQQISIMGR